MGTTLVFRRRVFRYNPSQLFRPQLWPQREKFMTARRASPRREPQPASYDGCHSRNLLRRNSLQFQIPANAASRIEKMPKRYRSRVKARLTGRATPWKDTHSAEQILGNGPPPRSPASRGLTRWAVHRKILEGLFARG
jgi:hypothetical protein